jgi:serine/threonine protein kinase
VTGDRQVVPGAQAPVEEVEGYRDLSVIGNGATSWVYRAYQERVRRWVALKVLQVDGRGDAVRRRFDRERSLLAELGAHPHIVQVLDAGRTAAGRPYVAMELCDGSLADRVGREGPLDWPEALELLAKIAGATQAAHDLGVLHRDIKPQNILVSRYGPLLADFGIARAKAGLGATTGTLQMSPLYAAPEVFFGAAPPSEASDVYSLGASLYAVLTGQTPFTGVSDDHVYRYLTRIQVEHPAAFGRADLPGQLVEIVARSISADPSLRHPSAGTFADELRACLHGRPLVAAPVSRPSGPAASAGHDLTEQFRSDPPSSRPVGADVSDATVPRPAPKRGPAWPPRPAVSGERWRPAPLPPVWRRSAPAAAVALCVLGLLAVATTLWVVDGSERTSAVQRASRPSAPAPGPTTAAPAPSGSSGPTTAPGPTTSAVPATAPASTSPEPAPRAAAGPFPVVSGFGLRPPPDAGRYRTIEADHRRAFTAALGVEVPAAQTAEVVAGGNVVGFVSAHPVPATAGDRWVSVELSGSAPGSVTTIGAIEVRVASSGRNWVMSWWSAPNGFVAVFGNEAALREYVAGLAATPEPPGG